MTGRYVMDERQVMALYLRGKYVHSRKGKYTRRHRRAPVARVVPQVIFSDLYYPTIIVAPLSNTSEG